MSSRGLVHLYLCECEIAGVSSNSDVVKFLAKEEQDNEYPTRLDLHHNRLGERGTIALAKTLLGMQWLQHLDLRNCGVGESSVTALCAALMLHKGLSLLDVRGNEVYASSGRRLIQLVKSRPAPLLVLVDLEQLPNRIAKELLEAMGTRSAALHSYAQATCVNYPIVHPTVRPKALQARWEEGPLPSSPAPPLVMQWLEEMEADRGQLAQLYAMLGNIVLQLSLDVTPSVAMSSLVALEKSVLSKSVLEQCVANFGRALAPMVCILQRIVPTIASLTSEGAAPPCASRSTWESIAAERGNVIHEQWDTVMRLFGDAGAAGTWTDESEESPDGVIDSPVVLLSRVVRGVAATSTSDLPNIFGPVEKHLDRIYTQVVVEAYEARRSLAFVCQRIGYLIQNHRPVHVAWRREGSTLLRPARVDEQAFGDKAVHWIRANASYAVQRFELVREALSYMPALLVRFLVEVVCEAAVATLYRKQGMGTKYYTLMELLHHEGEVPPIAAKTAARGATLVTGATADADAAPLALCGDIASVLGSIRTADHIKQLCRVYGQWLRWQYFVGGVTEEGLVL